MTTVRMATYLAVAMTLTLSATDTFGQTGPCTTPPATPQGVAARVEKATPANGRTAFSPATLTLTWRVPAASRLGSNAAAVHIVEAGSAQGSADVGQTAVLATDVALTMPMPNGVFYVRVRSANACGLSKASRDARVTIGGSVAAGVPNPLVVLSTVHATRERLGSSAFVRVMGQVRNGWSAAPAAFVSVAASYEGAKGSLGVTQATYVTGVPGRLRRTGLVTDTAIAPGGLGCFVLFAQFDSPSVTGLELVASPSSVGVDLLSQSVDIEESPTLSSNEFDDLVVSGKVKNGDRQTTFGNEVWIEARDDAGRVLDCRGSPVEGAAPDWRIAAGSGAAFRATTEAPHSMSRMVRWWTTWTMEDATGPAARNGQQYDRLVQALTELLARRADTAPQDLARARDSLRGATEALERGTSTPVN